MKDDKVHRSLRLTGISYLAASDIEREIVTFTAEMEELKAEFDRRANALKLIMQENIKGRWRAISENDLVLDDVDAAWMSGDWGLDTRYSDASCIFLNYSGNDEEGITPFLKHNAKIIH